MFFLYTFLRYRKHKTTATASAIGKAIHTACIPNSSARINATGKMIKSCLAMEIIILMKPCPNAWNKEMITILKPANKKLKLITRRAGIPSSSISVVKNFK